MNSRQVAIVSDIKPEYPAQAPFHPGEAYPEALWQERNADPNPTYAAVRQCFCLAQLDIGRYGTAEWNPLSELISPGETVLLKPNLVKERHPRDPQGWRYVLTHGSVIRAVADYVWKALHGRGKLIIADAPQTDSSFAAIVAVLGLDKLRDYYADKGLSLELIDLRLEEWVNRNGVIVERRALPGDPYGAVAYDLGPNSEFVAHRGAGNYYGADYDAAQVNRHHKDGHHEYLISGAAIGCDVIFSLPKLKTHKKAGITVSLKNLVGINADKNWLPHHTEGAPSRGGDEHPGGSQKHQLERFFARRLRPVIARIPGMHARARSVGLRVFGDTEDVIRSGNWFGNDTVWRMCLDLNKIVAYGNRDGTFRRPQPENRKRHYVLVDGIIAGEGRGPMNPDPVPAGLLLFGTEPPAVDATCAWVMGFDPEKIPIVREAFRCKTFALTDFPWQKIRVVSNKAGWNALLPELGGTLRFAPHFGWIGHIEREHVGQVVTR